MDRRSKRPEIIQVQEIIMVTYQGCTPENRPIWRRINQSSVNWFKPNPEQNGHQTLLTHRELSWNGCGSFPYFSVMGIVVSVSLDCVFFCRASLFWSLWLWLCSFSCCVSAGGLVVVFAAGLLECFGILVGVWASRASLCSSGLVCLFPEMSLGWPYFMVVGATLLVSSQGSMVCSGALRGCQGFGGFDFSGCYQDGAKGCPCFSSPKGLLSCSYSYRCPCRF